MMKISDSTKDALYVIFRFVVGAMFFFHGAQKFGLMGEGSISAFASMMQLPFAVGLYVGLVELVCGLAILVGAFTRIAAVLGSTVMIGAIVTVHNTSWNPLVSKGELALLYLACFLVLFAFGAGKWSLERALFKRELV